MQIACIVEGEGENEAFPVLVRRILGEMDPALYGVRVFHAVRLRKGKLKQQSELSRTIDQTARRIRASGTPGAVLVLLDADDDCPAELGPRLLGWAQAARSDVPIAVVVANREYEAWFLAAAESLRGHRGLATNVAAPADPEAISGAKEWLIRQMPSNQPYASTVHQASFSQLIDLEAARRAPSFAKLCRDVRRLAEVLQAPI